MTLQLPSSPANVARAEDVVQALRERYAAPEYAFLEQVRDATGYGASRTADALALGLWPSRGIHLHGFEVKVYRGDWRRELKRPEKAESIARFCHYWWIAAPAGIVPIMEVPSTWGLLELRGRRLQATKAAVFREDAEPIDLAQIAAIFRRASTSSASAKQIEAARQAGYKAGDADGRKSAAHEVELAKGRADRLQRAIAEFEEASGVRISEWEASKIGLAVKRVLAGDGSLTNDLASARRAAARLLDETADYLSPHDVPQWFGHDQEPGVVTRALEAELAARPKDQGEAG